MDCKFTLFGAFAVIFVGAILAVNEYVSSQVVRVEMGRESTISCTTNDKTISEVYWYRGSASHTSPILQLKNGKPGGSEYGSGHFEITDDGAMIIKNASKEQDAVYTCFAFLEDETIDRNEVTVYVISIPTPPCPHINGCFSCETCNLSLHDSGSLTCTLMEVRPRMMLNWTIESSKGINFTSHSTMFQNDSSTGTWDISVELSYTAFACEGEGTIHCVAQDADGILHDSSSTVTLKPGVCRDDNDRSRLIFVLVISLMLSVLIVVAVGLWVYCRMKKRDSQIPQIIMDKAEERTLEEIDDDRQKAKLLIKYLKEAYKQRCVFEPLPWGTTIPTVFAYADCELKVQYIDRSSTISSANLFSDEGLKNEERVVIVGETGCGKTSLTKALIQNWIDEHDNQSILLYIPAEEKTLDLNIINILLKILEIRKDVTVSTLESVLAVYNLWLLIDGIDDKKSDDEDNAKENETDEQYSHSKLYDEAKNDVGKEESAFDENTDEENTVNTEQELKLDQNNENSFSRLQEVAGERTHPLQVDPHNYSIDLILRQLTLRELLAGKLQVPKKILVWVTTRRIETIEMYFPRQYVKIKINEITKEQLKSYIGKICAFYSNLTSDEDNVCTSGGAITESKYSTEAQCELRDSLLCAADTDMSRANKSVRKKDYKDATNNLRNKMEHTFQLNTKGKTMRASLLDFVETNNVFKCFESAPSLLILIVHILAAKFTPAIPLPNRTINNMCDLISMVVKALEQKFLLSKTLQKSEMDMNLLEMSLEKVAFESVSEDSEVVVKTDSFVMDLNQHLKAAVAIGLMHQEYTASSRTVEFYHESIEGFFAARYIVKRLNEESRKDSIKLMKEKENSEVLKFVSYLQNSL